MTTAIDVAMQNAVQNAAFPSAELLVAKGGDVIHHGFYGDAREGTFFDVASLTKPVVTATLAMLLAQDGVLALDQTLAHWFGSTSQPDHEHITVGALLNHISGLPAWKPYYRELPSSIVGTEEGKASIIEACLNEPIQNEPGATTYSDIGFILLGEIIAKAGGAPLDKLFATRVAGPLNLADSFFVRNEREEVRTTARRTDTTASQHVPVRSDTPSNSGHDHRRRFAATEDCHWRGRVVHGQVHDQNAYAMGGVAGHAGLFSTASDLHRFLLAFMSAFGGDERLISRETAERFFPIEDGMITPQRPGIFVGGWDTPSAKNSAAGHYSSRHAIGHLAYTGCSIWIDQEKDFWVILLTNRIHPQATNEKIKAFRPHIHDLIYTTIIKP